MVEVDDGRFVSTIFTYVPGSMNSQMPLTETSPRGVVKSYTYGKFNKILTSTVGMGDQSSTTEHAYDLIGRMTSTRTPEDYSKNTNVYTSYKYNSFGELKSTTYPNLSYVTMSYDKNSNIIDECLYSSSNILLNKTSYIYNSHNKLVSSESCLWSDNTESHIASFMNLYREDGLIVQLTNPKGGQTKLGYDSAGRGIRQEVFSLDMKPIIRESYVLDNVGRIIAVNTSKYDEINGSSSNAQKLFSYNALGLIVSRSDSGAKEYFVYNSFGDACVHVNGLGNSITRSFNFSHKITKEINQSANGDVLTSSFYDEDQNVIKLIDHNGNSTNYEYDYLNNIRKTIFPNNTYETVLRDKDSRVTKVTRPDGSSISNSYSSSGLEMNIEEVNKNAEFSSMIKVKFGPKAKPIEINKYMPYSKTTISTTIKYDSLFRVVSESQSINGVSKTLIKSYDDLNNLTSLTYPNGTTKAEYLYDNYSRLKSVIFNTETVKFINYTGMNPTFSKLSNGISESVIYGQNNEILRISNKDKTNNYLSDLKYGYVGFNYRNSVSDEVLAKVKTFEYDSMNRVTSSKVNGLKTENITYDGVHNITSVTKSNTSINYTNNNLNQISTVAGNVLSYDLNGNMTRKNNMSFLYDVRGNLSGINYDDGSQERFFYDGLGRRVLRRSFILKKGFFESTESQYIYHNNEVIEERTDAVTVNYVLGASIDKPILMTNNVHKMFFHQDAQNNIILLTNQNGEIAGKYDYSIFGVMTSSMTNLLTASGLINPYGFTGRRIEEKSKLLYFRARYYDPELGVFLSRDPLHYIDGMNLYSSYFNFSFLTDPFGLNPVPTVPTNPWIPNYPPPLPTYAPGYTPPGVKVHIGVTL